MTATSLAESALAEIASRFVHPHSGIVLDYVSPDGSIDLPSPDELADGKPNALAWWTPGENGAFFTGLHLLALTRAATVHGDQAIVERARCAAGTLIRLASVGRRPGFVARMVVSTPNGCPCADR
ncbi:hypothetical protein [Jiangella endophytica]|uniref:hypothetical protein n=1 Tax=Jiangella endophytica TaxID=1623398 RepID=UPI000E348888|nr:hypothetical protein [Jiangella endophytica]